MIHVNNDLLLKLMLYIVDKDNLHVERSLQTLSSVSKSDLHERNVLVT